MITEALSLSRGSFMDATNMHLYPAVQDYRYQYFSKKCQWI